MGTDEEERRGEGSQHSVGGWYGESAWSCGSETIYIQSTLSPNGGGRKRRCDYSSPTRGPLTREFRSELPGIIVLHISLGFDLKKKSKKAL